MRDSDRCSGTVGAIDLSRLRLERPETPFQSRKQFEDSRPGTMEAFLGDDKELHNFNFYFKTQKILWSMMRTKIMNV